MCWGDVQLMKDANGTDLPRERDSVVVFNIKRL